MAVKGNEAVVKFQREALLRRFNARLDDEEKHAKNGGEGHREGSGKKGGE
jgi:hypothetical protein